MLSFDSREERGTLAFEPPRDLPMTWTVVQNVGAGGMNLLDRTVEAYHLDIDANQLLTLTYPAVPSMAGDGWAVLLAGTMKVLHSLSMRAQSSLVTA